MNEFKYYHKFEEPLGNSITATCYFVETTLRNYVESVSTEFKNYWLQRDIVTNYYLDNLYHSIINHKYMPSLVLTGKVSKISENTISLSDNFNILDGLQRTSRLINIYHEAIKKQDELLAEEIKHIFNYPIRLEIWSELNERSEIDKMLLLNAGHKPVSLQHQLELIFLGALNSPDNLRKFTKLSAGYEIKIIQDKDMSSITYGKKRQFGEFHLSHFATSLLSYKDGRPITLNSQKISELHKTHIANMEETVPFINSDDLDVFIRILATLDKKLASIYHDKVELGIKWIAKETVLNGICAALGKKINSDSTINPFNIIDRFNENLSLENFDMAKQFINIAKVNIGAIMKNSVYNAMLQYIDNPNIKIDWKSLFSGDLHD